jgi:peptidoglycan hydrolase CwlO-like protein
MKNKNIFKQISDISINHPETQMEILETQTEITETQMEILETQTEILETQIADFWKPLKFV